MATQGAPLRAAAVALAAVVLCSCGHTGGNAAKTSTTPEATSPADELGAAVETSSYDLTVTGAPPSALSAVPTTDAPPTLPDFLRSSDPGVRVTLPENAQPSAPLTLAFNFTGKTPPEVTDSVAPAVLAVSEGSSEPEVLRSHWDQATQTLTAQTEHLSSFFPISVDLDAVAKQFNGMINGFLGLAARKPSCVGKPLKIDDTTYTVQPESVPAAWPCLSANGDAVSVDLASNSPNGWIVRSDPPTTDMGVDLQPDVNNLISQGAYSTVFAASVGNGTFLLPGGTTHLRFSKDDPPRRVELRADPGVTLVNGLSVGLNSLFPQSQVLSIPGVVDCIKPLVPNFDGPDPTGAAIGSDTRSLIDCVTGTTDVLSTKPTLDSQVRTQNIAAKSLGAILALGPGLANQLAATLGGLAGELTGSNTQAVTITADKAQALPPPVGDAMLNLTTGITSDGAGLELGPNHFQISKRYHDKGRYYADVNYKWSINRPPDSDLGYCIGHVTVTNSSGAIIFNRDDDGFNACRGGGAFGTNLKLYDPGTYTVSAEIEMERGPSLHGVQQFTLVP